MNPETLIYGLAKDSTESWQEELLSASGRVLTPAEVEAVKTAAAADGFHSFRVKEWDGAPPNFVDVLNV